MTMSLTGYGSALRETDSTTPRSNPKVVAFGFKRSVIRRISTSGSITIAIDRLPFANVEHFRHAETLPNAMPSYHQFADHLCRRSICEIDNRCHAEKIAPDIGPKQILSWPVAGPSHPESTRAEVTWPAPARFASRLLRTSDDFAVGELQPANRVVYQAGIPACIIECVVYRTRQLLRPYRCLVCVGCKVYIFSEI